MPVNLEQIDMLKERANISYGEAKEVLEKYNNDVVEALIALEKESKVKTHKADATEYGCCTTFKKITKAAGKLLKKGNEIKFVIRKAEKTVIDMPVILLVIITAVMPPLTVAGILVALLTNHKIRFVKPDGQDMEINRTFDKISTAVNNVSNQVAEAIKE